MVVAAALCKVRWPTPTMAVRSKTGVSIRSSQRQRGTGEKGGRELRWWLATVGSTPTPAAMEERCGEEEEWRLPRLSGSVVRWTSSGGRRWSQGLAGVSTDATTSELGDGMLSAAKRSGAVLGLA